jgi:hypothetical protein
MLHFTTVLLFPAAAAVPRGDSEIAVLSAVQLDEFGDLTRLAREETCFRRQRPELDSVLGASEQLFKKAHGHFAARFNCHSVTAD